MRRLLPATVPVVPGGARRPEETHDGDATPDPPAVNLVDALQWLVRAAFVGLTVVAVRGWLAHRTAAAAWMAASFGSLAAIVVGGLAVPDDAAGFIEVAAERLIVAVLLAFPYLLFRFSAAIEPATRRAEVFAGALTAISLTATFALPDLPGTHEARPPWFSAYVVLVLAVWTALSMLVAVRLARARTEPRLARRRKRLLAGAALILAAALLVSPASGGSDSGAVAPATQGLALVAALLFYAGYAPPAALRTWWRQPEVAELRRAELALLSVESTSAVVETLLPSAAGLVGARSAAFLDHEGGVIGAIGADAADLGSWPGERTDIPMRSGSLAVWTDPSTPYFGQEELALVEGLGAIADLALDRARLLGGERSTRESLERSNEDLQRFASVVSHDLKEPLQVVRGFAHFLTTERAGTLTDVGEQAVAAIERGATRMGQVIDDLRDLAQLERSIGVLEPVDLDRPVRQALDALAASVEESGARVEVGDLPAALASEGLVTQVFQNLIANAVKYSGEGPPEIRVSATGGDEVVEVAVEDRGEGIPAELHDQIFEPFRRLHEGDGAPHGTGIGLALVQRIVELHGGRISVDSEPGAGSTFRFTLPSVSSTRTGPRPTPDPAPRTASAPGPPPARLSDAEP